MSRRRPPAETACPCGSGAPLVACCGRFLEGKADAPDAERLMRSRYSAFVGERGDYLLDYQGPVRQASRTLGLAELPHTLLQSLQLRLIASRNAAGSAELLEALDRAYEELRATGADLRLD